MPDDKREHDWNVAERRRYRIEKLAGEVDETRKSIADQRTHNGDTVQEYYDDVLIREQKLTIQMLEGGEFGRSRGPRKTPVFETRWCIDAASIAYLPKVIVDGRWSDPAATFAAGRGIPPTQPEGPWGVYAADFTDAYTLGQIEPLEAQYKGLVRSMEAVRGALYVQEQHVNSRGLFDNLEQVQQRLQSWIDECNDRIRTAQSKLAANMGGQPGAFNAPWPSGGDDRHLAQMTGMLSRLNNL